MARKLHEVLGAQTQITQQADKTRTELAATFEKKRHLFAEKRSTFKSTQEGTPDVSEIQSTLQSTVAKELSWITPILVRHIDNEATIDAGNTIAKADVKLDDGTVILTGVPATQLMQLAKRLNDIFTLVSAIPTLDPAAGFMPDPSRGEGIYVARETRKQRTKKIQQPLVLIQPTEHHPGQAQLITNDVVIGDLIEQEWSGLITPAEKSDMLDRIEELRRAVKTARARANDVPVDDVKIGQKLLDRIFLGK